jgi:SAM-dependent methyltransferase
VIVHRRETFDADPDNYARARPGYPERVYDLLRAHAGLGPGSRVLEIGPGTGQVTGRLLDAGAEVVAVELGTRLAATLRRARPDRRLTVVEGDFATVDVPPGPYDLAACATAWHWLDHAVAVPKLARLVRPGGWLAVWWHVFGDSWRRPPWRDGLDELYARVFPEELRPRDEVPPPMMVTERIAELTAGDYFGPARAEVIRWQARLDAPAVRRLFASFSAVAQLPPDRRALVLDGIEAVVTRYGPVVDDYYATSVYLAPRRQVASPHRVADDS